MPDVEQLRAANKRKRRSAETLDALQRKRGSMSMGVLLVILLVFAVILALLLGLSIGIAFLIAWLLPAVGLEMALLAAVIAVGQAILILVRLLSALPVELAEREGEPEPPIVILERELPLPRWRRKRT